MLWNSPFGYRRIQSFWKQQSALTAMQNLQREGRYSECKKTAQGLDQPSEELNNLEYQCMFQTIQQLVEAEEWQEAIAMANAIPRDSHDDHRHKAQTFIRGQHILALANAQKAGDIKQAMAIADEIEPNHPLQAEIQLARFKWQAEEKLWVESLDLLDQGKWQDASNRVRPLEKSPYFQKRAEALLKEVSRNQKEPPQSEATVTVTITDSQATDSSRSSAQTAPKSSKIKP